MNLMVSILYGADVLLCTVQLWCQIAKPALVLSTVLVPLKFKVRQ